MQPEVRASGAELRRWKRAPNRPDRRAEHDPIRDWELKSPMQLFERLIDTQFIGPARGYLADVREAIEERAPDVVLCSQFAFGAMIAAEAARIPFAVLMPNAYLMPAEGMPPFGLGLRPARTPLGRARDRVVGGFTQRVWDRKGLPGLNALRGELGLDPLRHFFDQPQRADRQIVMTSADFDFPAILAASVRYVGPVLDDPSWSQPWSPPAGDAPLVLVGLSSTYQDHLACLQRIADALGSLDVRGVVTTGPAVEPSSLRPPANVSVIPSAPHTRILEEAATVVTHGGHGTVVKSLAAGVPMVVMHHGRDQADNAARVVTRGAGIAVKRAASQQKIAAAVRATLTDARYRQAAQRLGASIRRDAASGALLRELQEVGVPRGDRALGGR